MKNQMIPILGTCRHTTSQKYPVVTCCKNCGKILWKYKILPSHTVVKVSDLKIYEIKLTPYHSSLQVTLVNNTLNVLIIKTMCITQFKLLTNSTIFGIMEVLHFLPKNQPHISSLAVLVRHSQAQKCLQINLKPFLNFLLTTSVIH